MDVGVSTNCIDVEYCVAFITKSFYLLTPKEPFPIYMPPPQKSRLFNNDTHLLRNILKFHADSNVTLKITQYNPTKLDLHISVKLILFILHCQAI